MQPINASANVSPLSPSASFREIGRRRQQVLERFNTHATFAMFPSEHIFAEFLHDFTRMGSPLAPACVRGHNPEKYEALYRVAICHMATRPGGRIFLYAKNRFDGLKSAALSLWRDYDYDTRRTMLDNAVLCDAGSIVVRLPDSDLQMPLMASCFGEEVGALSVEECARLLLSRHGYGHTLLHRFHLARGRSPLTQGDADIAIAWGALLRKASSGARCGDFLPRCADVEDISSIYRHLANWITHRGSETQDFRDLLLTASTKHFESTDCELNAGFLAKDVADYWQSVDDDQQAAEALTLAARHFARVARHDSNPDRQRRVYELAASMAQRAHDTATSIDVGEQLFLEYRRRGELKLATQLADWMIGIAKQGQSDEGEQRWIRRRSQIQERISGKAGSSAPTVSKSGDGPPPPPYRT